MAVTEFARPPQSLDYRIDVRVQHMLVHERNHFVGGAPYLLFVRNDLCKPLKLGERLLNFGDVALPA